jgi:phospholipid/cholesterol/gamma-HCH transport system permease protein
MSKFRSAIETIGEMILFFASAVRLVFTRPFRIGETIRQLEFVGNRSVGIISLTGLFTGLVFSYQSYLGFSIVNASNLVGAVSSLAIARELGPVLTGLIIAARAGGAMAAQLGTMRVTEQIDAISVMGVNARQYLVSPRVMASLLGAPMLGALFMFTAFIGVYLLCVRIVGIDEAIFWEKTQDWIKPRDIVEGIFKTSCFGVMFATICTYWGYYTEGGARGVGEATNQGVVTSMVSIIVSDFFITKIFDSLWKWIA